MPTKRGGNKSAGNDKSANGSSANLGFEAKLWLASGHVFANRSFNDSDWLRKNDDVRTISLSALIGERAGVRCRKDVLPKDNDNYVWVRHFIHQSLAPATLRDTLPPKLLRGKSSMAELQN